MRVNIAQGWQFCDFLGGEYFREFRNEVRGIGAGHGTKPSFVGFLAGKGDSLLGEGDIGVSAVNNSVMSCEVGQSKENLIVV